MKRGRKPKKVSKVDVGYVACITVLYIAFIVSWFMQSYQIRSLEAEVKTQKNLVAIANETNNQQNEAIGDLQKMVGAENGAIDQLYIKIYDMKRNEDEKR